VFHKAQPRVLFSRQQIEATVVRLAREINRDYQGKRPLLVGVLKGSCILLSDLMRQLSIPVEIEFVALASYGKSTESSGRVKVVKGLSNVLVRDRDIIIVEDIMDTGLSLSRLLNYLKRKKPASVKICVLLDKPSRRKVEVKVDYAGLVVPDGFIVGYGLDWNEQFRQLPDICVLEDK
jgi:hypoxanthine phosphoribosyltransferase